jgi:hypothetical protein
MFNIRSTARCPRAPTPIKPMRTRSIGAQLNFSSRWRCEGCDVLLEFFIQKFGFHYFSNNKGTTFLYMMVLFREK